MKTCTSTAPCTIWKSWMMTISSRCSGDQTTYTSSPDPVIMKVQAPPEISPTCCPTKVYLTNWMYGDRICAMTGLPGGRCCRITWRPGFKKKGTQRSTARKKVRTGRVLSVPFFWPYASCPYLFSGRTHPVRTFFLAVLLFLFCRHPGSSPCLVQNKGLYLYLSDS